MEQIAVYFTNNWVPATWLTPIVNIIERNWAVRVTWWICKELQNGFYIYNFDEYNPDKQYLYLFDWGSTLSDFDRYKPWNNEMDSYSYKQSWGRTVAATTPYDDSTILKKLSNIEKMKVPMPTKVDFSSIEKRLDKLEKIRMASEKANLSTIEKRLIALEMKKIEFPKIPEYDIDWLREEIKLEFNDKLSKLAKTIKPPVTPEEILSAFEKKEQEKYMDKLMSEMERIQELERQEEEKAKLFSEIKEKRKIALSKKFKSIK